MTKRRDYEISANIKDFNAIATIDLNPEEIIYGMIQANLITNMSGYVLEVDEASEILTIINVVPIMTLRLKERR